MKDAYWFKHDANARHDAKLVALRTTEGMAGIGAYWCLIEILREQADYQLDLSLEYVRIVLVKELDFHDDETLESYLNTLTKLHLVEWEGNILTCASLRRRMEQLDEIKQRRAEAGRKGGIAKAENNPSNAKANPSNAKAMPQQNSSNALAKPSYISTNVSTQLIDSPINQSTDSLSEKMNLKNLPDNQPVQSAYRDTADIPYSVEIAFKEIPLGFAFKPKELLETEATFIKMSETEFYDQANRRAMQYTGSGETTVFIKPLEALF